MAASGMDGKMIVNLFSKFAKSIPKWNEVIDASFLPEEMKSAYKEKITQMIARLKLSN